MNPIPNQRRRTGSLQIDALVALGLVSAVVFGLSVFMVPGAGANFVRQNLPPQAWGSAISLFTLIFAVAQIAGPYGAGLVADLFGNIGISLLVAAGVLMTGAALALLQRPLQQAR